MNCLRISVLTSLLPVIIHIHALKVLATSRPPFLENLVRIEDPIKTPLADRDAPQHRSSTERTDYCPENLQRIRICLNEKLLAVTVGQRFHNQRCT